MKNDKRDFPNYTAGQVPAFLPESIRERLVFHSCLSEKKDRSTYLVTDKETRSRAVLKIALPGSPDDAGREYEMLSKLDHPAVPKALFFERDSEGRSFLLRAWAGGETLDHLMERDGVFDERKTLEIIEKLCSILSWLHRRTPPVVYRDIKPQNIVLTPNGRLSLIDFGISREYDKGRDFDTSYLGSVPFAAPEQFGFTATDPRADVFALGKLALYLNTGDTNLPGFARRVSSAGLAHIIAKCTAFSPERRYPSVSRLARDIGRRLRPPTRREIATVCICAAVTLALGGAILSSLFSREAAKIGGNDTTLSQMADGSGFEDEVLLPLEVVALMDGKPLTDCAVSADDHNWYAPDARGRARLTVYPYDNYTVSAARGNRVAEADAAVTGDMSLNNSGSPSNSRNSIPEYTLDVAKTPDAPPLMEIDISGEEITEEKSAALEIKAADAVTPDTELPPGFEILKDEKDFRLSVSPEAAAGHYTIPLTCTNEWGRAYTTLSIICGVADAPEAANQSAAASTSGAANQSAAASTSGAANQSAAAGTAAGAPEAADAPTEIDSPEALLRVAADLGGSYVLTRDIDLSGIQTWTPIGNTNEPFTGVFDGRGHRITGLNAQLTGGAEKMATYGFFGKIERGIVRNLVIADATVAVKNEHHGGVGIIAGVLESGLIKNCAVVGGNLSADIAMESAAGGIAGENSGVISNSFSSADVAISTSGSKTRTETYAGGICGKNSGYVENCANTGGVTGISIAGGLAGFNDGGVITRSYNAGKISAPMFMGIYNAGGICHIIGRGTAVSDCAYLTGTAEIGASVWNEGVLLNLNAADEKSLKNPQSLARLLNIEGENPFISNDEISPYASPQGMG